MAQRSALEQMLDGVKLDGLAEPERGERVRTATEQCEDAASALMESARVSCPGTL